MKKQLLYLVSMLFLGTICKAQNDYDWRILSSPGVGLFTASSNTYSLSYFKGGEISGGNIGERIYVATREGTGIDVLNATDGSYVKSIPISGSGFKNTKIRVTDIGEIYSVTMRTALSSSSDGQFITVNYLEDENSTVDALSLPYPPGMSSTPRMGDSFDVVGSGNNAVLFIGGSVTQSVYIYKRNVSDGVDFVREVPLGGDLAAFSISIVPNESDYSKSGFFVSHNTTSNDRKLFLYDEGTNSYIGYKMPLRIHDATATNNFSQIKYFKINNVGYLMTSGGSTESSKKVRVFKILGNDYTNNINYEEVRVLNSGSGADYSYVTGNAGPSDLEVSKEVVSSADFVSGKYTLGVYQLVTRNTISKYSLIFNLDGTLPVSLSDFNASIKNGKNTLTWKTHNEDNNEKFEVQRSDDGKSFETIGVEMSKAENGNSSAVLNYQFIDENPLNGINYYRLKQVDKNGQFKLYDVQFIKNGINAVYVYPNPTTDVVNVDNLLQSEISYAIYNAKGKLLFSGDSSKMMISISLHNYPPGIYFVKVTDNDLGVKNYKIVKQ